MQPQRDMQEIKCSKIGAEENCVFRGKTILKFVWHLDTYLSIMFQPKNGGLGESEE